jgi:hypothetical protein
LIKLFHGTDLLEEYAERRNITHLNPIEKKFKAEFRYSILESIIRTNLTAGSVELVTELTLKVDPQLHLISQKRK